MGRKLRWAVQHGRISADYMDDLLLDMARQSDAGLLGPSVVDGEGAL